MKLIAYKTFDYNCQKLVPAARTREWMDKTPGSAPSPITACRWSWPTASAGSDHQRCAVRDGVGRHRALDGLKVWPTEELTEIQKHYSANLALRLGRGHVPFGIHVLDGGEDQPDHQGPGEHAQARHHAAGGGDRDRLAAVPLYDELEADRQEHARPFRARRAHRADHALPVRPGSARSSRRYGRSLESNESRTSTPSTRTTGRKRTSSTRSSSTTATSGRNITSAARTRWATSIPRITAPTGKRKPFCHQPPMPLVRRIPHLNQMTSAAAMKPIHDQIDPSGPAQQRDAQFRERAGRAGPLRQRPAKPAPAGGQALGVKITTRDGWIKLDGLPEAPWAGARRFSAAASGARKGTLYPQDRIQFRDGFGACQGHET